MDLTFGYLFGVHFKILHNYVGGPWGLPKVIKIVQKTNSTLDTYI